MLDQTLFLVVQKGESRRVLHRKVGIGERGGSVLKQGLSLPHCQINVKVGGLNL
jgi:hypothetical protein